MPIMTPEEFLAAIRTGGKLPGDGETVEPIPKESDLIQETGEGGQ